MTPELHMTRTQEKRLYRNAVLASLEAFYGKSKPEATKLVREWWTRLSSTRAFESGIFLHAEPMNTAASIADLRVVAISGKNRAEYHRILDESRALVLSKTTYSPTQSKKTQADRHKQFLHIASSSKSSSARNGIANSREKDEEKQPAQKQQVAYN